MLSRLWCDVHGQWVGGQLFWVSTVLHARGIRAIRATAKSKATSWAPTHEDEAQVERCKRHDSDSDWFEHILDGILYFHVSSCICELVLPLKHAQAADIHHHSPIIFSKFQQWKDMERYEKIWKEDKRSGNLRGLITSQELQLSGMPGQAVSEVHADSDLIWATGCD